MAQISGVLVLAVYHTYKLSVDFIPQKEIRLCDNTHSENKGRAVLIGPAAAEELWVISRRCLVNFTQIRGTRSMIMRFMCDGLIRHDYCSFERF